MNTKETNTGCVIKYTFTTTHQCAKQVYKCATKLSPRNKSAVQTRINRPLIAAYLQSNNTQNNSLRNGKSRYTCARIGRPLATANWHFMSAQNNYSLATNQRFSNAQISKTYNSPDAHE